MWVCGGRLGFTHSGHNTHTHTHTLKFIFISGQSMRIKEKRNFPTDQANKLKNVAAKVVTSDYFLDLSFNYLSN